MTRSLLSPLGLALAVVACGKDATPPVNNPTFRNLEIYFHLSTEPTPDTAILRWWKGTAAQPQGVLGQVEITGNDSSCAYFLVTSATMMYFDLGWKRHGDTLFNFHLGPFNGANPVSYVEYWGAAIGEDTLAGSSSINSSSDPTTSRCPPGMKRDSVAPRPVP